MNLSIEFCGYPSSINRMIAKFHYGYSKLFTRSVRFFEHGLTLPDMHFENEIVTFHKIKTWKSKSIPNHYGVHIPFESYIDQRRVLAKLVIDMNLISEPIKLNNMVVTTTSVGLAIVSLQCCKGGEIANMLIDMANDKLIL